MIAQKVYSTFLLLTPYRFQKLFRNEYCISLIFLFWAPCGLKISLSLQCFVRVFKISNMPLTWYFKRLNSDFNLNFKIMLLHNNL